MLVKTSVYYNNRLELTAMSKHVYLAWAISDMDRIKAICDMHNVPIIEDAAESLGATYKGKKSGTFDQLGIYSFNRNKITTTSGGGMFVSEARDNARHYQHSELGFNYRMSNVCTSIGRG